MPNYKICINNEEDNFLESLKKDNPKLRNQLCNKIKEIKDNPFNSKFKSLKGDHGYRRARSGDYRIIYFVEKNRIFITRIGLRKNVYERKYTV